MSESTWAEDRAREKQQRVEQTEALARLDCAPAFSTEGFMGLGAVQFTFCRKCGAAIPLVAEADDETHPLVLHHEWHETPKAPPSHEG